MQTIHEKPDDLQPVIDVFQHSTLKHIVKKARFLLALDREVKNLVPSGFGSYCHVMNVNQNTLILGVTNAAIATRIQMVSARIIDALQKKIEFAEVRAMRCKVCVDQKR